MLNLPRVLHINQINDGAQVRLHGPCVSCSKVQTVTVDAAPFHKWRSGMHIQDAMPDVSDGDREFLLSSICEPCFDAAFKESDDE